MFFNIDLSSLLLSSAAVNVVMICVLVHTRIYHRTYPGFSVWIAAVVSNVVGQLALVYFHADTTSWPAAFGATFVVGMPILGWYGLRLFMNQAPGPWAIGLILCVTFGIITIVSVQSETLHFRRLMVTLTGFVFCALAFRDIRLHLSNFISGGLGLMQVSLIAACLVLALRAAAILWSWGDVTSNYPLEDSRNTWAVLCLTSIRILWVFSFVMLTQQRLELELIKEQRKTQALAQKLQHHNSSLLQDSRSDALTGLVNRRGFDESLALIWNKHKTEHCPLALLMIDVDHFKLFNDTYGHAAGDDCLRRVGMVLTSIISESEHVACRYGGEEFTLLLQQTNDQQAQVIAKEVLQQIETIRCPFPVSPTTGSNLSVSIGVYSATPHAGLSPEGLIQKADEALYEAKRSGRNRQFMANNR
ncbi:MAG: GGDEF domain-containing protein [Halieaceae bacterium]|nr:GGDEF domain-containing protein [Halieaceae bacterium]